MKVPVILSIVWRVVPALLIASSPAAAQKFFPDDPVAKEPPPFHTENVNYRALSTLYELFTNSFGIAGEHHPANGVIPAEGVNTLGEVMDGPWFVNRHARKRLMEDELVRGAGDLTPPSMNSPWRVVLVQKYDIRPGIVIVDSKDDAYVLRFDPPGYPELKSGAGMIAFRIYHALGYWVPETYLVKVRRDQFVAAPEGQTFNAVGRPGKLLEDDINLFLENVAGDPESGYRAVAMRLPKGVEVLGPYQMYGVRRDDPNDIVPHEHRRDLRGLYVISSWLNNSLVSPLQSTDILVTEGDLSFIRHYISDAFFALGSALAGPKEPEAGNTPLLDLGSIKENFLTFGIGGPRWQTAEYPDIPSVGRFESKIFEPEQWQPYYMSAALANRLPDDNYWATKQILAFTDDDIRAIVKTAQFSDPRAEKWIADSLIERRDKIARHYLRQVLPLDNFRIDNNTLQFDDIAFRHGYGEQHEYRAQWFSFNNQSEALTPVASATGFGLPDRMDEAPNGSYFVATIESTIPGMTTTVFIRKESDGMHVVGVERNWPGKVLAQATQGAGELEISRYGDLDPRKKELFDNYVATYNKKTGFSVSPEDLFRTLSLSEHTTFDAVTHALSKSNLTDATGNSMGVALDLVEGIERIAGQYYGRQGDEQFRLYVLMKPNAREVLDKSKEFHFGHENTVYHIGYPFSYRQEGNVPNIQISLSDDGAKADIDVDYRASKLPQSMWNGHLSSANSDIRAGDNYDRHINRWTGLSNWWQEFTKGLLGERKETAPADLLAVDPVDPGTPLPPNRPIGAIVAEPYEAVQELLTDWLVRGDFDQALDWISDTALSCARTEDGVDPRTIPPAEARARLREVMRGVNERLGKTETLGPVVQAIVPWRKAFRLVDQPFHREFAVVEAPDEFAQFFKCETRSQTSQQSALEGDLHYGNYYGALFQFKTADVDGAALGVLLSKEKGNWKVVAWEVYEQ